MIPQTAGMLMNAWPVKPVIDSLGNPFVSHGSVRIRTCLDLPSLFEIRGVIPQSSGML